MQINKRILELKRKKITNFKKENIIKKKILDSEVY